MSKKIEIFIDVLQCIAIISLTIAIAIDNTNMIFRLVLDILNILVFTLRSIGRITIFKNQV